MEEILSYEDFKEELKQRIQEQADGYSAVERRIEINNGVFQEKLICESKEDNLVPAVPLKTLYSVYLQIGMDALVEMVVKIFTYRYQVDNERVIDVWEKAKNYLSVELVNAEWNQEWLKSIPHMRMFNFALVVRVGIWVEENDGRATCTVTNKIIEKWGIGEEELFDAALTNFQKEEFDIISIDEMLNELQPNLYYPECEDGDVKTYMMTNRQRYKGAVGMLRLDLLKQLAEKEQSDLYIFPSSIHECVLVPVNGVDMTIEELQEMLQETNESIVSEEERLDNVVYYYRRTPGKIEIAEDLRN